MGESESWGCSGMLCAIHPTGCHISLSGSVCDSSFDEGLLEPGPKAATDSSTCDERPGEYSHQVCRDLNS